jgi:hypothetical protein
MREGKILGPLRELTAANSANQRRAPLIRRRDDETSSVTFARFANGWGPVLRHETGASAECRQPLRMQSWAIYGVHALVAPAFQ